MLKKLCGWKSNIGRFPPNLRDVNSCLESNGYLGQKAKPIPIETIFLLLL